MAVLTEAIQEAIEELREAGFEMDLFEEAGQAIAIIHAYPVLPGWSEDATRLLLKLPTSFPNGKPDMFWTDINLTLRGGGVPFKGDIIETIRGEKWRRFSWHPSTWVPGRDSLFTYLEFVNRRLAQRK